MPAPTSAPTSVQIDQSDGDICLSWTGVSGATGYQIQRSLDGVNFTNLAATAIVIEYIDSRPGVGVMYWYQVAATNGSGTGPYSSIVQMVAAQPAEMSLYELDIHARQTADRLQSPFISQAESYAFARLSNYELYDILMTAYEDWFASEYFVINTDGTTANYPLPDGTNYLGGVYGGVSGAPAKAFYKLAGMDLNVNTSVLTPSRVTLMRFDFIKRNQYVYPNSTSTIYGVYNMRYRIMGNNLNIIPTPAGNQTLIGWYSPRMPRLLKSTDLTTTGVSGWLRYVIVRMAKYMLDKEEGADTSKLDEEILYLKKRIEEASQNRDAGIPDTISETRMDPVYGGTGWGGGNQGGW